MNDLTPTPEAEAPAPSVGLQPRVIQPGHRTPPEGVPVLALITAVTDLCTHQWREVVHHDGDRWRPYAGSDTFADGEQVERWIAAEAALPEATTEETLQEADDYRASLSDDDRDAYDASRQRIREKGRQALAEHFKREGRDVPPAI